MSERGQATVEHLGLLLCAVALTLALAVGLAHGGLVGTIARAIDGDRGTPAPDLSLAAAALIGDATAPTVDDVAVLLADSLGSREAQRRLDELAVRVLSAAVVTAPLRPHSGDIVAHVVTPADEAAVLPLLRLARRSAERRDALLQIVGGAAAAAGPVAGVAGIIAAGGSQVADRPGAALPAGARAGDVVLCAPVWQRVERRPPLQPLLRPAMALAVVRAGIVLRHRVIAGDDCRW